MYQHSINWLLPGFSCKESNLSVENLIWQVCAHAWFMYYAGDRENKYHGMPMCGSETNTIFGLLNLKSLNGEHFLAIKAIIIPVMMSI